MISEFSTVPKPSNNKAKHLFFIFLILAVAAGALYVAAVQYKGIVGVVCLVFIVGAIYVYNRYMAIVYHYDIMIDSDGTPLFIVRHVIGKRESTLCRVELASIRRVEKLNAEQMKKHTTPEGFVRYVYTPTLSPATVCLLTVQSRYERAEITIEGSDEFISLLSSYAEEARKNAYADEE